MFSHLHTGQVQGGEARGRREEGGGRRERVIIPLRVEQRGGGEENG